MPSVRTVRFFIVRAAEKFTTKRIAIVGLGGTGAYLLDLVAKTPVPEIQLFDGDEFLQHNAFRAPGAASLDDLRAKRSKVQYYADVYGRMRRGIIPHPVFIDDNTVEQLAGFDFVFVCVDRPAARKLISSFLHARGIPFIDVGMELELIDEHAHLVGTCRVTLSTTWLTSCSHALRGASRNLRFARLWVPAAAGSCARCLWRACCSPASAV